MSRMHLDPDNGDTSHEEVACPVCAGIGYVVEHDGARDWCDECGMSGLVSQQHADNLANARLSIAWMKEDATKEEMIDFLAGRRIEK